VCRPVNIDVRDGTHYGLLHILRTKLVPLAASFFRFGICTAPHMGLVGSSSLPSISSDIKNSLRMYAGNYITDLINI